MPAVGVHAVVPVKDLGNAKQRLAGILGQPERTALFRAMLEDVLEALAGSVSVSRIVLVTRDAQAMALARRYGAECLVEPENRGHTAAVEFAAGALAARGAEALLQVPGDIPRVTSEEIEAVIAAHAPAPAVTIAPSRDHRGSNAVLCSPPDVFPFRFGDDSFHPHLAAARAMGIEPAVVERPGIGLDIDTPGDLEAFLASPSDTRAYRLLAGGARSYVGWRLCAIAAARLMIHKAASAAPFPDVTLAAQAKVFASDMAIRVTNDALQCFGARGYSRNLPLERMARDARMFTIGGGTAQILRTVVASRILERKLPQTRDGFSRLAEKG